MSLVKRILFGGYAPVHFHCFRPVYALLRRDPDVEIWLTGAQGRRFRSEGLCDSWGVEQDRIRAFEALPDIHFDVVIGAHSSSHLLPKSFGKSVQLFHGISFCDYTVREKVRGYDYACVMGSYQAGQLECEDMLAEAGTRFFLTGFPRVDALGRDDQDREGLLRKLGLEPHRSTVLYAPASGRFNSLEEMGEDLIKAMRDGGDWNILIKPGGCADEQPDWLAPLESDRIKLLRDSDVQPYLSIADLLVTDAAAVAMEYTLLDRPMVFVDVPKLLRNVVEQGGALDLETFGRNIGTIARGPEDLARLITGALANPKRESELRQRAAREMFHDHGNAAKNVADVIRMAAGLAGELPQSAMELVAC